MKAFMIVVAFATCVAMTVVSDASAQSWGRRGANVRCLNGGSVQGKYFCNLKNAPSVSNPVPKRKSDLQR